MQSNNAQWQDWIGKTELRQSVITRQPMEALAATLNKPIIQVEAGAELPPLWHWLYFLETARQDSLASDGHARRGDFLPPISLPRRMWASSRLEFLQPLQVGDAVQRLSRIESVSSKQGKSGQLAFVTVNHEISHAHGIAILEQHDIVYREAAQPGGHPVALQVAPDTASFTRTVTPDPVLLFRYSALTFNGHRIHYDREFATHIEGYPGLVVHGPLLATLMVDLLQESLPACRLRLFEFRALAPVFDTEPFMVCCSSPAESGQVQLWVANQAGELCMQGSAVLQTE